MPFRDSLVAALLVIATAAVPCRSDACVAFGSGGELVPIRGEEALIVWDEAAHTEHFVRRATFADVPADFGFLVPTPGRPSLHEAPDAVFHRLFLLYRGRREAPAPHSRFRVDDALTEHPSVTVVERVHVAGMEGTVLLASDATALDGWLGANGYRAGYDVRQWLEPYVARGWFVTAFRIDPGGRASARTHAICMSFETDRPFFPYSEPVNADSRRPFRVSVVGPHRVVGLRGDRAWAIDAGYAGRPARLARALRGAIPAGVSTEHAWLTTFDDRRSLRGTDDLFFVPAPSDEPLASSIFDEVIP